MKIRISNATESHDMELPITVTEITSTHPAPLFTATPTTIQSGGSVTLAWSADQANGIYLDGAPVTGPSNTKIVTVTASRAFTLRVTYPGEPDVMLTQNITVTQPQPSAKPRLGYNVLSNGAAAGGAWNDGCRFFLIIDDTAAANALANQPDTIVMYRQYWNHVPSSDELVRALHPSRLDPRIIRTFLNEREGLPGGVPGITLGSSIELNAAQKLRALNPNLIMAAGTFSTGTPDFIDAGICKAIQDCYAPAYNSGLIWWDHHLYSPDMAHIYDDGGLIWYERRWEFLFSKCGFNPSLRHIVSGECGVDQGGVGGFRGHNATPQQVTDYARRWVEIQSRPVLGVASPVVGGAFFQLGDASNDKGHWGSYDMTGYTSAVKAAGVY